MSPEERIIALEREVGDTRIAAARMILDFAEGVAPTRERRERLARAFEANAQGADQITARLARLVVAELRRRDARARASQAEDNG